MRITMKTSAVISNDGFRSLTPGETVDVPDETGEALIAGGIADAADPETVDVPDETGDVPETRPRRTKKITAAPENKAG